MKTTSFIKLLALLVILGIGITTPSYSQKPEQLFQQGLIKEEGEGSLQEAIDIYGKVVENQDADKSLQAKALLHVGLCYEKLGKEEATRAYQQLVNNYPGQMQEVAIARERLNKLILVKKIALETPLQPKFTKINIPTELSWTVKLSPDGKNLLQVSDNKLWALPLEGNLGPGYSGTPIQINTNGIEVGWTGLFWSYDDKWIAFNEYPETMDSLVNQWICIVPSGGGIPNKVAKTYRGPRTVNYQMSISPDSKKLAFSSVEKDEQYIYTIPINGDNPKRLVNMEAREPVFSPDGKLIAFAADRGIGRGEGDLGLWIAPSEGGTPHLVANAIKATSPVWSPDCNMIAYIDEEQPRMFIAQLNKAGQITGNPVSIDAPEGISFFKILAGWMPDNKIGALLVTEQESALYTMPVQGGQAAMIQRTPGAFISQPRWSPDGKQVYYSAPPEEVNSEGVRLNWKVLASVAASGGNGKPVLGDLNDKNIRLFGYGGGHKVSPDGKTIIVGAWTPEDLSPEYFYPKARIWKLALDGAESTQITTTKGPFIDTDPCWSPDGTKIAFIRHQLIKGKTNDSMGNENIYIVNSSGGEPELLDSFSNKSIFSLVWSPDGSMIACLIRTKEPPFISHLYIFNIKNRKESKFYEVEENFKYSVHTELAWSPKSKRIAFNYNDDKNSGIKVFTLSDSTIEDIKTGLTGLDMIVHLDWSPDEEKFVFSGWKFGKKEFYMVENFLPLDKLAKKEELKEPEGIRIKQIWKAPYLDDLGTVSLDGKYRSYVDWGVGNVGIHNLKTGEKKILTHDADLGDSTHFAEATVISKNGKKIAYSWWNPYNTNSLRLINVENPVPELLYKKTGEELYPSAWLSDKEIVAFRSIPDTRTMQLVTFNIMDKKIKVKKTFLPGQFWGGACSPDKKYIAYGFVNNADKGNTDIRLLEANGDREIPLITHPSNDKVLGWVPGRKEFLFISDRSGSWDLWAIKLDGTKPLGPAKRIYVNIGEVDPMGFTRDGECYFGFSRRNFYSGLAPLNKETGEIDLESGQSFESQNFLTSWSPDGQHLAYIEIEDGSKGNPFKLFVQDIKSGGKFQPDNNTLRVSSYRWSPDGKSILVIGREINKLQEKDYKGGIFLVDIKTGQIDQVLLLSEYEFNSPQDDSAPLSCVEWAPDKKNFYYLFQKDRLVNHNLETGEDKIIYKFSDFSPYVLETSPDGRNLLFGLEHPGDEKSRLYTIPAEGGKEKTICTSQEAKRIIWAKYSPNGSEIYFVELPEFNRSVLWRVPVQGGKPEKIWSPGKRVEIYDIHPDGNQVAFSIRERTTEVRVIENLAQELEKIYSQNE